MKAILRRLSEPFPEPGGLRQQLISLFSAGIFVAAFLYLIRPFDLGSYQGPLLLVCLGFGAVTFIFGVFFEAVLQVGLGVRKDLPSWTLGKWMLQTTTLILWVALGNYLFLMAFLQGGWSWYGFFWMLGNTLLVGIFPITISGLLIQMRAIKQHQAQADALEPNLQPNVPNVHLLELRSEPGTQSLQLPSDDVWYLEAMQNYVAVWHQAETELKRELLRNTIKQMSIDLAGSALHRCHRSYLVNLDQVVSVSGNAQGLKLRMGHAEGPEVPVSRSYISRIKALLGAS
ncbi:MAG: LytTR family DNA-binding domain-containing protein [Bacteroidota bacterium]